MKFSKRIDIMGFNVAKKSQLFVSYYCICSWTSRQDQTFFVDYYVFISIEINVLKHFLNELLFIQKIKWLNSIYSTLETL